MMILWRLRGRFGWVDVCVLADLDINAPFDLNSRHTPLEEFFCHLAQGHPFDAGMRVDVFDDSRGSLSLGGLLLV